MNNAPRLRSQRGFTLIELVVVMAIIATAVALVVPQLSSGEGVKLEAQVRDLMAVLNHARRTSIIKSRTITILLQRGREANEPSLTRLPDRWESRGAKLKWAKDNEFLGSLKVTFYPTGGCSGGTLLMIQYGIQARVEINSMTCKMQVDYEAADPDDDMDSEERE